MTKIKVWQKKSIISEPEATRRIVRGLGLRGFGQVREHKDNNCIRGMLNKVKHLVAYEIVK